MAFLAILYFKNCKNIVRGQTLTIPTKIVEISCAFIADSTIIEYAHNV